MELTSYIVEAHNGRQWVRWGTPYKEYLGGMIEEALEYGYKKIRYRTMKPYDGKWAWQYVYNKERW